MNNPFEQSYFYTSKKHLAPAVIALIESISDKEKCIGLLFFGKSNDLSFETDFLNIKALVAQYINPTPLVGFVPQELCGEYTFGLELTKLNVENENATLEFKFSESIAYACLNLEWGKTVFIQEIHASNYSEGFSKQSDEIFNRIDKVLKTENIEPANIVRQWNYVGHITDSENGNQHYQLFNNARTRFYDKYKFYKGFPAATGISMDVNGLIISLIAVQTNEKTQLKTVDNSLQIPAHKYSCSVLIDGETDKLKTTPKFERAKWLSNDNSNIFFISGTAAIRNENSSLNNNASLQTKETIDTINFLISIENLKKNELFLDQSLQLKSIRVYIKKCIDYEQVKNEIDLAWPGIKAIYLQAEVCRKELLVNRRNCRNLLILH